MEWKKKGFIYACDIFETGYAADPFIDIIDDQKWRIYFTPRTKDVISLPFFMDVEAGNPSNILQVGDKPLFLPGAPGTFDDTGITMTSILNVGDVKYLYYCGWNKKISVPYSLSIGLAISTDNGATFTKLKGPVLERSKVNPIAVSAPMVIFDEGIFKMWYITFTQWKMYNGRMEPTFIIKYATSDDGINWEVSEETCFNSNYDGESFARPWVIKDKGIYKMWFSSRGPLGYREKGGQHYTIEYAESADGVKWNRIGPPKGIEKSETGWDSEMLAYASVTKFNDIYYMLYNGNYFGKAGFGYAESY